MNQKIAAEVLEKVEEEVISAKEALRQRFAGTEYEYNYKVRGSVHAYVMEVLKRRNTIDFLISLALENKKVSEVKPFIRNILRIGIYEMVYKNVPPPLATDSMVRIVKKRYGEKAATLVNGVMRRAEYIDLNAEIKNIKNKVEYLSLKYSHPKWFVKYTINLLGEEEAIKLMESNLGNPNIYVRVNELKATIEKVRRYLEENKVILEETPLPEVFKVVSYSKPPPNLEWHQRGYYIIQDLASAFVTHVLNPEPGEVILDLAAAPGAKTSHIAMRMENEGKIIAIDNSKKRMERMKAKMKILGVKNVEYVVEDGAKFFGGDVDKVLVDPPCSSTGSFVSYPASKWRFEKSKFKSTIKVQRKMLKNAFKNAKSNAITVYSTCSITFEENEENMIYASNFFKVEKIEKIIGERGIKEFKGKKFPFYDKVVRTFPHRHECAGFFIAKLVKE